MDKSSIVFGVSPLLIPNISLAVYLLHKDEALETPKRRKVFDAVQLLHYLLDHLHVVNETNTWGRIGSRRYSKKTKLNGRRYDPTFPLYKNPQRHI